MTLMRLQKWLSAAGICSRRQGEAFILAGKVRVNGKVTVELGTKIDPERDKVEVEGQTVAARQPNHIYVALHKPRGYVTSCSHAGQKVVVDLVNLPERIYPIGRLDKDSTGLLLLTNDGRLHHRLSHPSFDHEKEYEVVVDQPISDSSLKMMTEGILLGKTKTRLARIKRLSPRTFRIVLQEGRNRQIRRMVEKLGCQVMNLKRIRMAHIRLGELKPGAWRHLTAPERKKLLQGLDVSTPGKKK